MKLLHKAATARVLCSVCSRTVCDSAARCLLTSWVIFRTTLVFPAGDEQTSGRYEAVNNRRHCTGNLSAGVSHAYALPMLTSKQCQLGRNDQY